MSVQGAYKTLLKESKAMSKEDAILQSMLREWIWEYVLKDCSNCDLIRTLALNYPLPDNSLHLKRLLLLKSLSFDLSELKFTERTLETISALLSHCHPHHRPHEFFISFTSADGKKTKTPFSIQDLYLAVRVECTVQYLRDDMDDWPRFYTALGRHWADFADDTQEPESVDAQKFLELKDELLAVQKQPELRHKLLKRHKREHIVRMMECFLSDAWEDVGLVFLEQVVQNVKKGAYVPDDFVRNNGSFSVPQKTNIKDPKERLLSVFVQDGVCEEPLMPPGSSSERSANVDIGEDSRVASKAGTDILIDTSMVLNSMTRVHTSLPENAVNMPAMEDLNDRPSPGRHRSVSALKKDPHLPPDPPIDVTGPKDPESTGKTLFGQKHDQDVQKSRRRIPMTLQEKYNKWTSVNVVQGRALRSSNSFDKGNTALLDLSSPCGEMPLNKGACSAKVETTLPATAVEQRDGEVEPIHLSPPSWAGSPAVSGMITLSNKRQKLGPLRSNTVTSMGAVETPDILRAQSELRQGQAHLSAVVQDPLPEAFKIAEEAVRTNRRQWNGADQGMEHVSGQTNNLGQGPSPHLEEAPPGPQGKPNKRSIMDRNPTAHTIEWETSDDIADSPDDNSPSRSRQVRLPQLRTQHRSRGISASHQEPKRRAMRRWTQEEECVFRKEVLRYGKGQWKHILQKHSKLFEGRTEVDLKDKWRNIERREGIL